MTISEKLEGTEEWHGNRLWSDTRIDRLLPADVEGEQRVEGVYQRSLIPREMITAIQEGTFLKYQQALMASGGNRGGMLHVFREPPLSREDPCKTVPSVCEQMKRDFEEALQIQTGEQSASAEGKVKPIYEGKALVPREGPRRILAWATWTRSQIPKPLARSVETDMHVEQLLTILDNLSFDRGVSKEKLQAAASRTILFDTLNADPAVPGGASLLFNELCGKWLKEAYTHILLYRHKILQMVDLVEEGEERKCIVEDLVVPQWNNDASQNFFRNRGFADIGTRYSSVLAPREWVKSGKVYPGYVLSTEGWMAADLKEAAALSQGLKKRALMKFW